MHRLGQRRSVTVFRLLVQGTVEEVIGAVASRKQDLDRAIKGEVAGDASGRSGPRTAPAPSAIDGGEEGAAAAGGAEEAAGAGSEEAAGGDSVSHLLRQALACFDARSS